MSAALTGLSQRVGGWRHRGFLGVVVHLLLYGRLCRARDRFEGLVARYLAGTLRRMRPGVEGAGRASRGDAAVGPGIRDWPARFGWLLQALQPPWRLPGQTASWEAGQFGALLRHALESVEVQAMVVAVPQAARVMGPICRMLAIPPCVIRPGFVAKVRAVRDPAVKRVRKPRPVIDWGRTKVPRGVKTWIRKELQLERAQAELARAEVARAVVARIRKELLAV